MANIVYLLLTLLAITTFATRCLATTYTVGDSMGWDISTNVDSWAKDKHFVVGDVLLFQFSSSHSVAEVNRDSYQGCNTTNVLLLLQPLPPPPPLTPLRKIKNLHHLSLIRSCLCVLDSRRHLFSWVLHVSYLGLFKNFVLF
ncbi:putative Phytocyanin domain, cupredoxin [Helianthus annuus]|nr:putative Phytocyanin domain, cupredoxin [Helianthus annuus]